MGRLEGTDTVSPRGRAVPCVPWAAGAQVVWWGHRGAGQGSAAFLGGARVALGVTVPRALVGPPGRERQGVSFVSSERRPSCGIAEVGVTCRGFSAAGLRAVGRGARGRRSSGGLPAVSPTLRVTPQGAAFALPRCPQLVLPEAKLLDPGRHRGAPGGIALPARRGRRGHLETRDRSPGQAGRSPSGPPAMLRAQEEAAAGHVGTGWPPHPPGLPRPSPGRRTSGSPHALPGPQGTEVTFWAPCPPPFLQLCLLSLPAGHGPLIAGCSCPASGDWMSRRRRCPWTPGQGPAPGSHIPFLQRPRAGGPPGSAGSAFGVH